MPLTIRVLSLKRVKTSLLKEHVVVLMTQLNLGGGGGEELDMAIEGLLCDGCLQVDQQEIIPLTPLDIVLVVVYFYDYFSSKIFAITKQGIILDPFHNFTCNLQINLFYGATYVGKLRPGTATAGPLPANGHCQAQSDGPPTAKNLVGRAVDVRHQQHANGNANISGIYSNETPASFPHSIKVLNIDSLLLDLYNLHQLVAKTEDFVNLVDVRSQATQIDPALCPFKTTTGVSETPEVGHWFNGQRRAHRQPPKDGPHSARILHDHIGAQKVIFGAVSPAHDVVGCRGLGIGVPKSPGIRLRDIVHWCLEQEVPVPKLYSGPSKRVLGKRTVLFYNIRGFAHLYTPCMTPAELKQFIRHGLSHLCKGDYEGNKEEGGRDDDDPSKDELSEEEETPLDKPMTDELFEFSRLSRFIANCSSNAPSYQLPQEDHLNGLCPEYQELIKLTVELVDLLHYPPIVGGTGTTEDEDKDKNMDEDEDMDRDNPDEVDGDGTNREKTITMESRGGHASGKHRAIKYSKLSKEVKDPGPNTSHEETVDFWHYFMLGQATSDKPLNRKDEVILYSTGLHLVGADGAADGDEDEDGQGRPMVQADLPVQGFMEKVMN
ncbi:hypothetical protein DFP72DRAFT_843280 [Ephemerocybe angulata]|uniref:Uncharacterized protein n=1 Tax=Ephemerocybe angulata TaxID=980116 RepID=A0A8H6I7I5_9AGAR|nr:hypothetical protein DFP72DRAFT_843280 [Tulosesus angulatus]